MHRFSRFEEGQNLQHTAKLADSYVTRRTHKAGSRCEVLSHAEAKCARIITASTSNERSPCTLK
jgi:hypothetical protein